MLAYLLLPNLLFWSAGVEFETLPRAIFNLDYLAIAAIAPFLSLPVAVGMMSLALLADTFRCSGSIYYFSQRDALSALVFLRELPLTRVAGVSCIFLLAAVALGWVLVRVGGRPIKFRSRAIWISSLILIFSVVGVGGGTTSLRFRDDAATWNLCSSAGLSLMKSIWMASARKHDYVAPLAVDSSTRRAGWMDQVPASRNLVLVIVESGGMPNNPEWRALINSTFDNEMLRSLYDVTTGEVPFTGATIPAEFRELCAVRSGVFQRPPDYIRGTCLPNRLRSAGFQTLYIHGFSSSIFNRRDWLPGLGFDQTLFHGELRRLGMQDCGEPFRGTCDEDIAGLIAKLLVEDREQRHFIEFMTLNSHLPISADSGSSSILQCGTQNARIADTTACNLIALVIRAERAIVKIAVRPDLPQTEFLIVGDHAPPFLRRARRDWFDQQVVPFVRLTPKTKSDSPEPH